MSKHVIRLPKWNEKETEDSYMCVYLWYIYLYAWEMFIYICEIMAKIFISIVKTHIYIFQKLRISNRVYSKKAMAPHSSTLAWKIPWTEGPGRLQSMRSPRVGHDWQTSLSIFTFHFHALEKEMATHSSILAWRIPGMGKPSGLPSMGLHRVGQDWSNLAAAATTYSKNTTPKYIIIKLLKTKRGEKNEHLWKQLEKDKKKFTMIMNIIRSHHR